MTKGQIPYVIVFCLYMAAVLYLCFAKPDDVPTIEVSFFGIPFDKVAHFIMFLPYPFLAFKALDTEGLKSCRRILLPGIVLTGACMAAMTEFIQSRISYRSADAYDLAADFLGISIGVIAVIIYHIIRKNK